MDFFERNRRIAMMRNARALPKVKARRPFPRLDWHGSAMFLCILIAGFLAGWAMCGVG